MGRVVLTDPTGLEFFVIVPTKRQCHHLETGRSREIPRMCLLKSLRLITACRKELAWDSGNTAKVDGYMALSSI